MIEKSFYEYFLEIIKQFGNAIALIDPETMKSFTYLELINQSEQMRNALIRLGIQFGDTIGTYVNNSSHYIIFILAAISIGAILVPLNPSYKIYEIGKYFKKASVKWILTEEKLFEKIQHLKEENIQAKIIMLDSTKETLLYYTLQCYLNNDKSFWNNEMINNIQNKLIYDYNTAIIFFSSGTTGLPKGIRLSHRTLIANVELVRKTQGIKCGKYEMVNLSGTDVVYGVLPYFHAGGLLTVLSLLGLGVQIIINRKFDAEQFLGTLNNYQVTTALLVPPVLKFLADTPGLNSEALHSLKYIFVGSAHVNESLVEMVKYRLPKTNIIQLYGTTEAGAFVFMQPLFLEEKIGSCGILLPNVECKIVKLSSNEECEEKEIGEIWLKTSTMMQGYLERTTDTNDAFIDGWYRTGDLGYYDFDQFIYITGRIKEMIKVRGWQVSPYEIEEKIQELEDVELCAVIGIPDEYSGQLPKAYIQLHDGCQPDENTIHRLVNSKFASYKQLKGGIQFINNMPVNSAGKILRKELLKMGSDRR
uniref:AMP-binding enzyme family protein n=2 Tax=Wuchereria bancrofti TaxID=6293 RepID=A0AAF5RX74_WUCBA